MAKFYSSRLEKKNDEEITRKTVIMGAFTILTLVLVLVFGLPFLVKISVLLGEAKNRNANEQVEKVMPPLPPRIVINYDATNSAIIKIFGLSEPRSNVKLLKNDVSVGEVITQDSGEFVFSDIALDDGENQLAAFASNEKSGSSEMSKIIKIRYDNVAPSLSMLNPSEDSLKVDMADFDVIGQSEKDVSVTVNGRYAMVDDTGKFKIKLQLNSGKNEIEVVVHDLAGNETRKKIVVTFEF